MRYLSLLWFCLCCLKAYAGIYPENSRIIYRADEDLQTLTIQNTNDYPILVQSFVDDGGFNPNITAVPFVTNPAIMQLAAGEYGAISIIFTGDNLPNNQESLFWLNLHEIPAITKQQENHPYKMLITINTQLKLLYRPANLAKQLDTNKLVKQLNFKLNRQHLTAANQSAYFASITELALIDNKQQTISEFEDDNLMLNPFSQRTYAVKEDLDFANHMQVRLTVKDDLGISKQFTLTLTAQE